MAGFGGVGVGLSRMMEGVSGGALAGAKTEMAYNAAQAKQKADSEYKAGRLQMMQSKMDLDTQKAAAVDAENKRKADFGRVKLAYDLAKNAPDPSGVFRTVQEKLNPDGDVMDLTFDDKTDDTTLSFAGTPTAPGYKIRGHRKDVDTLFELVAQNPNDTKGIMGKATELGIVSVEALPWKPNAVDTARVREGYRKKAADEKKAELKAPKVSDYTTAITAIGKKYAVNTGSAFQVGEDGAVKFNPAGLSASKETAFSAIKRVISTSKDPAEVSEAQSDLANMKTYYAKIDGILGGKTNRKGMKPGRVQPVPGVPESSIQATMKKYNMTRQQVIDELRRRGKI